MDQGWVSAMVQSLLDPHAFTCVWTHRGFLFPCIWFHNSLNETQLSFEQTCVFRLSLMGDKLKSRSDDASRAGVRSLSKDLWVMFMPPLRWFRNVTSVKFGVSTSWSCKLCFIILLAVWWWREYGIAALSTFKYGTGLGTIHMPQVRDSTEPSLHGASPLTLAWVLLSTDVLYSRILG